MAEFGTFQMYCNLQYNFSECPLWLRVLTERATSRRKGGSVLLLDKKLLLENSFGIPQDLYISGREITETGSLESPLFEKFIKIFREIFGNFKKIDF